MDSQGLFLDVLEFIQEEHKLKTGVALNPETLKKYK